MRIEKTSQQKFEQKYLLKTMSLNIGDLQDFSDALKFIGEKRITLHPDSRTKGKGLLATTGNDTADYFERGREQEFFSDFMDKTVEITSDSIKMLRGEMQIAKSWNMLSLQARDNIKSILKINDLVG